MPPRAVFSLVVKRAGFLAFGAFAFRLFRVFKIYVYLAFYVIHVYLPDLPWAYYPQNLLV
jgi:hypothetical protein